MMIPYGYKQTEVGVIPEDWECVKIKDVATISMCKRIFANQTSTIGDVPFYKIGTFGKEADAYISRKLYVEYRNKYSFPQKGDILISAAGTLGRTVVYDGEKAYFQDSNIVWLDINKTRLCNEYLNQYYKVIKWASSEGSTIARLYNGIIYATYISLPPLPEQQRIAEALSDVDGMISSLEKLIAKYKSIKTACLQQMFPQNGETVPRMRLPGFTGAWEQRKLGDVVQITMGQSPDGSTYSDEPSDYILVQGNADLQNGWVCPRIWTTQITKKADAGDLIMSVRAPAGAMGKTAYNAVIGRGVAAIKGNEFIYQLLVKMDADGFWKTLSCGSTFESLNSDNIKNAEVKIPTTAEQIKIGGFFQYLDNLITLHQRKLEEMEKQKKALMQLLLTGIVRVQS